ncbi:MAG: 30S ribosomal protein S2 [Candidatus Pacebacteria bacterium]|nr:30S ribosomal protein S2 [Candidatus Paceibacterota bacterium]
MEVSPLIQEMFEAGMHLGYSRTRRHPSTVPFIFANKSRGDVVDLEKTAELLEAAMETVRAFAAQGGTILFVGTKPESRNIVRAAAERIAMPFVENRWVGGTLTNFGEIRKRVNRLVDLQDRKEKNQLVFKTKKERLMLEREIIKLEKNFGGLVGLAKLPAAIIVIDSLHEDIAVKEARTLNIPIIALANTDANIDLIQHPVVGNDSSVKSIGFFTKK